MDYFILLDFLEENWNAFEMKCEEKEIDAEEIIKELERLANE